VCKLEIMAFPDNCTGCLRCMLSCSESHAARFSLPDSRVRVELKGNKCTITFLESCTRCALCAESCLYGALRKVCGEEGK
jgi:Fe-S-cluster-containing hydrogenase component 2